MTTDLEHEYGTITTVEEKKSKTGKTFWAYAMNGKHFTCFDDLELTPGTKGRMTYARNGQYYNAKGFILGDGIQPDTTLVETIRDKPLKSIEPLPNFDDRRRKEIQIGQACNLAQTHLFNSSFNSDTFDVLFKEQAKRYFKLLQELHTELI